jgi:Transposase C of IS166 homeodomain
VIDSPSENMQSLPQDAEALRALVLATLAERDAAVTERDTLLTQNDRLRHLLLKLTRMHFGARSERLPEEQLQLGLEALEQAIAKDEAQAEKQDAELRQDNAAKARQPWCFAGALAAGRSDARARGYCLPMLPGDDDGDRRGHLRAARRDPGAVSMAARNSPESSGRNSPLHSDLVTAESPRRCDIGEAIEVEIDDFPKCLGGGAVAQAFGQCVGPSDILGL